MGINVNEEDSKGVTNAHGLKFHIKEKFKKQGVITISNTILGSIILGSN